LERGWWLIAVIWSYILPILVFGVAAGLSSAALAGDKRVRQAILKAGDIVLSEKELERRKDGRLVSLAAGLLLRVEKVIDFEKLLGYNMKQMLKLMGEKKAPERIYADHLVTALLAALPFLLIPLLTGFIGYVALYPAGAALIFTGQTRKIRRRFKSWQNEVISDIPELIDKMRISLASGKDYISALAVVRENSGPRLSGILDKLINDMQVMRPAQALDQFAEAFGMPVMVKFVAAVKVGIETGYEQAENYFTHIEQDIRDLRKLALDELTRNKPEKVALLKGVMVFHAIAAFCLTALALFSSINRLM